jgi:protein-S-isoprenylcysteine O-methyltransferase Ste14
MPFMYFGSVEGTSSVAFIISDVLATIGFALATVALFELGSAFGVSPANRGRVTSGIYRFIGHPMYLGYILSEVGLCFINPLNIGILFGSSFLYLARMRAENQTLGVRLLTPSR